jgi:hypothetical protein
LRLERGAGGDERPESVHVLVDRILLRCELQLKGWVKVKNPNYWRRDSELEAMMRSRERAD